MEDKVGLNACRKLMIALVESANSNSDMVPGECIRVSSKDATVGQILVDINHRLQQQWNLGGHGLDTEALKLCSKRLP